MTLLAMSYAYASANPLIVQLLDMALRTMCYTKHFSNSKGTSHLPFIPSLSCDDTVTREWHSSVGRYHVEPVNQ